MSEPTQDNYDALLFALWSIRNSTEPGAFKHLNYDHLEANMFGAADAALNAVGSDDAEFLRVLTALPTPPQDREETSK